MDIEKLFHALGKILSDKEDAKITFKVMKRGDVKCQ